MSIKSNKLSNISSKALAYFFLIVIFGTSASNIDYNIQSAFSQGNNSSVGISIFTGCPNIAFNGPGYKDSNGCPSPCPTNTLNPPPGCPSNPIGKGTFIGNQTEGIGIGISNSSHMCPQIAFSGPSYTGPDGCPAPCPTNTTIVPSGCPQQSSLATNNSLPLKIKSNKQ